jgi:nitrogenase subunit NifH
MRRNMKKTAICGTGGTGKSPLRSQEAGLPGYFRNILQNGYDPKVEPAHLLPGGQTQARVPDITRFQITDAISTSSCSKGTWDISSTKNPVVPNRVMGEVFEA